MENSDKLRKGLECCKATTRGITVKDCDIDCPYFHEGVFCKNALHKDALAYIQQLEERNKTIEYTLLGVMHSIDKWLDAEPYDFDKDDGTEAATRASNAREVALKAIDKLESRLAQVERERDAAVRCLMEATKDGSVCTGCRHDLGIDGRCEEADFDCKQCKTPCMCKTCKANSNYQWRGVCDDDTEDKE